METYTTKVWTTKDGEEIVYKDLKDDHLLNILVYIKRKAKEGLTIEYYSWGYDDDNDFMTPDYIESEVIYGDEVLEHYDYNGLEEEAKKRKLI